MKKIVSLIIVCLTLSFSVNAQVGIGNNFPNDTTILDLTNSNNRGLLLPKINGLLPNPTSSYLSGMLLYKVADSLIYYKNSPTTFNGLSSWKYKVNGNASNNTYLESGQLGIGYSYGTALGNAVEVNGNINASQKVQENGNDLLPRGVIVMWSGTIPPAGWALCDGNAQTYNGVTTQTPDLQGRFIAGYDPVDVNTDNPGDYSTGGTAAGDLGGSQALTTTGDQALSKTFYIYKGNLPNHDHGKGSLAMTTNGDHRHSTAGQYDPHDGDGSGGNQALESGGSHNTGYAGDHTHTITGKTGGCGGCNQSPITLNMTIPKPKYYTLAYIIKL